MADRLKSRIEINAPVSKIYDYWKTLENLPRFMSNVEEVKAKGNGSGEAVTHWSVKGPLGKSIEFDARTTRNEPNEAIAWNSVDGDIQTSGQVLFEEVTPNRTALEVTMNYWDVPGGRVGEAASKLTGGPKAILEQDLKNFKDIMEERATPEEVQQRPTGAKVHSAGVLAFLTSGAGIAVVGGGLLLYLLLRNSDSSKTFGSSRHGVRFIVEL